VAFNADLFNWYQKFIGLRKKYKSIQLGDFTTIAKDDAKKLYVFSRKYKNEEVIVVVNRGNSPVKFNNVLLKTGRFKNVFTNATSKEVTVNAMDVVVLANQ